MTLLPLDQVSSQLPALICKLAPGEEIVVVDGEKHVAKVTSLATEETPPVRRLGTAKGILTIVAEDDEHLQDFAEYM